MSANTLLIVLSLLACGSTFAFARDISLENKQDVVITLGLGGRPTLNATAYTDQILFNFTRLGCVNRYRNVIAVTQCLRVIGHAGYEAIAHYSDRSVGYLTGGKHRVPKSMRTLANQKKSVYHAIATALNTLYNNDTLKDSIASISKSIGLDLNDTSTDPSTPVGLGNLAGLAVAAYTLTDGSNMDGSLGGYEYNKRPFIDYTGYQPVNSPFSLTNKSRWQPDFAPAANFPDVYFAQVFGAAHACNIKTVVLESPASFQCKRPGKWNVFGTKEYREAAETLLDYNRRVAYNETAKMNAELMDYVPPGEVNLVRALAANQKWTFEEEVHYNFAFAVATWDTTITTICCKRTWDTIRPFSVIRQSGLFKRVLAYGGQEYGIVDMPASNWKPYNVLTGNEPEYPSGSAAVMASATGMGRLISGGDKLGAKLKFPKGTSRREVNVPKDDIVVDFPTWSSVNEFAKDGRLYGGVHFPHGVEEAVRLGTEVSAKVYKWATALFNGKTQGN